MCQISAQSALKREWKSERIATPSAIYEQTTDNLGSEKIGISNKKPPKLPSTCIRIANTEANMIQYCMTSVQITAFMPPFEKNINIVYMYNYIIFSLVKLSAFLQMNKLNGLEFFRYYVTTKNHLHRNMKFSWFYGFSIRKSESKKS